MVNERSYLRRFGTWTSYDLHRVILFFRCKTSSWLHLPQDSRTGDQLEEIVSLSYMLSFPFSLFEFGRNFESPFLKGYTSPDFSSTLWRNSSSVHHLSHGSRIETRWKILYLLPRYKVVLNFQSNERKLASLT